MDKRQWKILDVLSREKYWILSVGDVMVHEKIVNKNGRIALKICRSLQTVFTWTIKNKYVKIHGKCYTVSQESRHRVLTEKNEMEPKKLLSKHGKLYECFCIYYCIIKQLLNSVYAWYQEIFRPSSMLSALALLRKVILTSVWIILDIMLNLIQ